MAAPARTGCGGREMIFNYVWQLALATMLVVIVVSLVVKSKLSDIAECAYGLVIMLYFAYLALSCAYENIPDNSMMISRGETDVSHRIVRVFVKGRIMPIYALPEVGRYDIFSWSRASVKTEIEGMADKKFTNLRGEIEVNYSGSRESLLESLRFGGKDKIEETVQEVVKSSILQIRFNRKMKNKLEKELIQKIEGAFPQKMKVKVTFLEVDFQ